jgi:hypothetical protein
MSGLYREKARVTRVRPYAGTTSIKVDTHDTQVFPLWLPPSLWPCLQIHIDCGSVLSGIQEILARGRPGRTMAAGAMPLRGERPWFAAKERSTTVGWQPLDLFGCDCLKRSPELCWRGSYHAIRRTMSGPPVEAMT